MNFDDFANGVTTLVVGVSAVVAVIAVASAIYIGRVYSQRHEQALFLDLLVRICVRVSVAAGIILGYLALALSGFSLGKPWGAIVIGVPVILMMSVPLSIALLWYQERRVVS